MERLLEAQLRVLQNLLPLSPASAPRGPSRVACGAAAGPPAGVLADVVVAEFGVRAARRVIRLCAARLLGSLQRCTQVQTKFSCICSFWH